MASPQAQWRRDFSAQPLSPRSQMQSDPPFNPEMSAPDLTAQRRYSPIASLPPVLPPIPRVATEGDNTDERPQAVRTQSDAIGLFPKSWEGESFIPDFQQSPNLGSSPLAGSPISLREKGSSSRLDQSAEQKRSASYSALASKDAGTKREANRDSRSVSLAVPYATTATTFEPKVGGRPLQATTMVNGIPQHRTSSYIQDASKPGKRGFNMLNPVNLLMRRRSSQPPGAQSSSTPPMNLPDDYDPRIRGNMIHDFSAPRPKRDTSLYGNLSPHLSRLGESPKEDSSPGATSSPSQTAGGEDRRSVSSGTPRRHSGFMEHLDDSVPDRSRSSGVHAETLQNQGFLTRFSLQSQQSQESSILPPFARKSQQMDPQQVRQASETWQTRLSDPSSISTYSEVSALSRLPTTDEEYGAPSPVSPDMTPRERFSQPLSNDDVTRLSLASTISGQQPASQTTPSTDMSQQGGSPDRGLPKHFKSNASRFSFQLSGQDSIAEERLLEEKAKLKRASAPPKEKAIEDDEEDFFDEDAMYDHDELEDQDDDDEDDTADAGPRGNTSQSGLGMSLANSQVAPGIFVSTPATNRSSEVPSEGDTTPSFHYGRQSIIDDSVLTAPRSFSRASSDYGDSDARSDSHQQISAMSLGPGKVDVEPERRSRASHDFDDDIYFHDGNIDLGTEPQMLSINEDDFDDPNFLKKDKAKTPQEFTLSPYDGEDDDEDVYDVNGTAFVMQNPSRRSSASNLLQVQQPKEEVVQVPSEDQERDGDKSPAPSKVAPTPEKDSLAAYHSALASSVQRAASSGRFSRQTSNATSTSTYSQQTSRLDTSMPPSGAISRELSNTKSPFGNPTRDSYSGFDFGFNDRPISQNMDSPMSLSFPVNAFSTDESRQCLDDGLEAQTNFDDYEADDDDIISEANADALATDSDGFYGQEFGFYAAARPGSEGSEAVNGGYFGEAGLDMIQRNWSLREPNLTPITERSEFSTRNSFVGGLFSPGMAPVSNPAFAAQVARMSPLALAHLQEEGMSLEHIQKLRAMAANGEFAPRSESISSLSSAASHHHGLPSDRRGSWQTPPGAQYMAKGGTPMAYQYSTDSSHSSTRMSRSQSENLAEMQPAGRNSAVFASSPLLTESPVRGRESANSSPQSSYEITPKKQVTGSESPSTPSTAIKASSRTHSRNASGADSVTYKSERDAEGNKRWVLERRRTSEGGLLELVGREVVEGGRI